MKKLGRPKTNQKKKVLSVSFSSEAWEVLSLVKPGKRSELISILVASYSICFPNFFNKKDKK